MMKSAAQVSPSYYLDVLMIVREKLAAFTSMIIECILFVGKSGVEELIKSGSNASGNVRNVETATMLWNDEVKSFLEEQVYLMLQRYTEDYFQKELAYVKAQYCDILKNAAAQDPNVISKVAGNDTLPRLRPDKVKSISILNGIVNSPLVHGILSVTAEAVARMGSIGTVVYPYNASDIN